MKKGGVLGQAKGVLPIRPAEKLLAFMDKDIRPQDAFPAVAVEIIGRRACERGKGFLSDRLFRELC